MKKSKKSTIANIVIGQKVQINYSAHWDGIFRVVETTENTITVRHPENGLGAFIVGQFEVIPLTKLDKALR